MIFWGPIFEAYLSLIIPCIFFGTGSWEFFQWNLILFHCVGISPVWPYPLLWFIIHSHKELLNMQWISFNNLLPVFSLASHSILSYILNNQLINTHLHHSTTSLSTTANILSTLFNCSFDLTLFFSLVSCFSLDLNNNRIFSCCRTLRKN